MSASVLSLLLSDARTPSGAYAHSGSLEAAVNAGLHRDVRGFMRARLRTVASVDAAFAAASCSRRDPLVLDAELAARTPAAPQRLAMRAVGRGLLRVGRKLWPSEPRLGAYARASDWTPRPVVFGLLAATGGLTPIEAARLTLYEDAAGVAAAAVKLLPLDAAETTAWLASLADEIESLAGAAARAAADAASAGTPAALPATATPRSTCSHSHTTNRRGSSLSAERRALRIGVAGPVGTGKSSLIAALCAALGSELRLGVVTNDIYTTEDAEFLRAQGVLAPERIVAVQTGCCPHTAIRDDVSANLQAVEDLEAAQGPLAVVFVESGGDNLTTAFSPALADTQIFVLDCAGGDDVPRKGGPGVARSDLLVINKVDLAPLVGASVERMVSDAGARRGGRPTWRSTCAAPAASSTWRHGCCSRRALGGPARSSARTPARPRRTTRPTAPTTLMRTASSTPTRTERPRAAAADPAPAAARVVAARAGAATLLRELRAASPWAPRPLPPAADGSARVALVQTAATLLSGDDCALELEVGDDAALELIETGATIAHDVRGGAPARMRVRIVLGAGARLTWLGRPLVLAHGCDLTRETTILLAPTARLLLRETVVLGRSGEQPGRLDATLHATHAASATPPAPATPLLHEQLATADPALTRSPLVAGGAATVDSLILLGARGAHLPGASQLAAEGTVWRALHPRGVDPDPPALAVARAWSDALRA